MRILKHWYLFTMQNSNADTAWLDIIITDGENPQRKIGRIEGLHYSGGFCVYGKGIDWWFP